MGSLSERLADALRASGRRLTPQRRLILEVLAESDAHLSASTLHDRVRKRDSSISLATVYRTLAVLKEMGLVEEHRLGQDQGLYEAIREERHYHFTCVRCGKVIEFDTPLVGRIEQELDEQEGVGVIRVQLHVSGYCAQCRAGAY